MNSSISSQNPSNTDAGLSLTARINALLPQTQCTKCGYQGCLPYAEAIAHEQAPINRCPPGGDQGIARLAQLLDQPVIALNPDCGEHLPRTIARILQEHCIGCTLCISACPVDAIVGAPKRMHQVIEQDCTGCDLCVAPCPVDCIVMEPANQFGQQLEWTQAQADRSREKTEFRIARLAQQKELNEERLANIALDTLNHLEEHVHPASEHEMERKKAVIEAALARARARRNPVQP